MAIKTQGTRLFAIDPGASGQQPQVLSVGCPTSIDGIDTTLEQIETTCLGDQTRTYVSGLATPGSASFEIQFDPADNSHVRMHELKVAGIKLDWALGFSDGTQQPTLDSNNNFELPTTRSWIAFQGFMNSYPFSFQLNSVVTSTVGIQISGEPEVIPAP